MKYKTTKTATDPGCIGCRKDCHYGVMSEAAAKTRILAISTPTKCNTIGNWYWKHQIQHLIEKWFPKEAHTS